MGLNFYQIQPKAPADRIAAELRKHDSMSIADLSEIMMALAGLMNRTPLLEGSAVAAMADTIASDLEMAQDIEEPQEIPE